MTTKLLQLDLDAFSYEGYMYTQFDVGGAGHEIYIEPGNKEKFLDEFAAIHRKRAEEMLEEVEVDWTVESKL